MKFTIRIDKEKCKGCEMCVAVCPGGVLSMSKLMNSRGQHFAQAHKPEDCTGCKQCALVCPEAAIEIEKEED
jgi:2-oxoglutarate ferredoxin oxidoreductase subunit delta